VAKANRNSGKPWTAEDLRAIKRMVREDTPTRVMSTTLGRTEAAIYVKASQEGISLRRASNRGNGRRK
jgi:hypothetical protein